ncbi:efflux RND transporter periplasmic adaptor subunit [uncultured Roseibium sp.]|uniref:efflux RND transporter periplasmic adaptor subunit n=1 Tax=uncultured Roseibium sp. TaxID=1936171 RepID=UPI00321696EB
MAAWRQLALILIVCVVAAGLWARFYPGAGDQLDRWGGDWLPFETAKVTQAGAGGKRTGRGGPRGVVATAPVVELTINDRLSAIGTGRAARSVEVSPFSSGRLTDIPVRSGATVTKGQVLAKLDSDAEEIAAERAALAVRDAEARLDRMKALQRTNTVTAVQVTDAELVVDNARLQLREAKLALSRRAIEAPIAGIVGILPITAGNYVTTQTVIAMVDDRSEILVDFWIPERYASAVAVDMPLVATSVARPGETFEGKISAIDNHIDSTSRTLQVQATLPNVADRLRAGMSFLVEMRFPGDQYPAVSPLAVQWGSDGAYVWAVRDGKAVRVPVQIVERNTDSVLVNAKLTTADEVVTEGLHLVRPGAELNVANQGTAPAPPSSAEPATAAQGS